MKIGIIGLGLIGGSLFKDLRSEYDVVAVSQSQTGDCIYKSYDVLKDCDVVFVCSAMNKTLLILDELENLEVLDENDSIPLESDEYLIYKLEKDCHVTTSIPANEYTKQFYKDELKRIEDALD